MASLDKSVDLEKKKEEWLEKMKKDGKIKDQTEWHRILWKTMQNKKRREIIAFIGDGKSLNDIKEAFNLDDMDANIHLGMLETALYIDKSKKDGGVYYFLTPFGEGELKILKDTERKVQ